MDLTATLYVTTMVKYMCWQGVSVTDITHRRRSHRNGVSSLCLRNSGTHRDSILLEIPYYTTGKYGAHALNTYQQGTGRASV